MRPVIQLVDQGPNRPKIVLNENGLAVLKKVVLEAETHFSYLRHQGKVVELPKRFDSGPVDKFHLELVVVYPEVDPADPAQYEQVEPLAEGSSDGTGI